MSLNSLTQGRENVYVYKAELEISGYYIFRTCWMPFISRENLPRLRIIFEIYAFLRLEADETLFPPHRPEITFQLVH